jgi:hypothetical protein
MLRLRFTNGIVSVQLDLRGLSSVLRLVGPALVDLAQLGMHPSSPHRAIVLRNQLARGKW